MSECVEALQKWFLRQCNGDWEHGSGILIATLDNPGWSVTISLRGTDAEQVIMPRYVMDISDDDWIFCEIKGGKFLGDGDPSKLLAIIEIFMKLLPPVTFD